MLPIEVRLFRNNGRVPIEEWLADLESREPKVHQKCLVKIMQLAEHGNQLREPASKYLRDGILELRIRHKHVNYRILYFFNGNRFVCLSHGLTKEDKVPYKDIESAIAARKLVSKDPEKHTAEWDI